MSTYAQFAKSTKVTPQTQRTPGRKDEVRNNAGGYTFKVADRERVRRFLVLGSDSGSYYVNAGDLTKQNANFLIESIERDEQMVLDEIVEVSHGGLAPKQSPALFALALVFAFGSDVNYREQAFRKVVRTGTHLFEFCGYLNDLAGWGRSKRRAVASFYDRPEDRVALQLAKYRQRNGWSHRDVLRLSHGTNLSDANAKFALTGAVTEDASPVLQEFYALQNATSQSEVNKIMAKAQYATWEFVPTQYLNSVELWKSLFYSGRLQGQALVRNVTRLAKMGAFNDMVFARDYANKLTDKEMLERTRLHPVNLLNASVVYREGQAPRRSDYLAGGTRSKDWRTDSAIATALDDAFMLSFETIEPAGKRTLVGLDVSGSMGWSRAVGSDLTPAQVGAAMSMTFLRTEPYAEVMGFASEFRDLGMTARMDLGTITERARLYTFGRTDCAQPMLWALKNRVDVDTFVVITDNETYAGRVKPHQALTQYSDQMGIDARLVVMGTSATEFTIADPKDNRMLDVAGFDSSAPAVVTNFSAGRF